MLIENGGGPVEPGMIVFRAFGIYDNIIYTCSDLQVLLSIAFAPAKSFLGFHQFPDNFFKDSVPSSPDIRFGFFSLLENGQA